MNTFYAIDSDYLLLEERPSLVPGAGQGVFAKFNMKAGDMICEYRGPVIKKYNKEGEEVKVDSSYVWFITDPEGDDAYIMGSNICAKINDCLHILNNNAILNKDFLDRWEALYDRYGPRLEDGRMWLPEGLQCVPETGHNVKVVEMGSKVFLLAARDIVEGEELFVFYGHSYCKLIIIIIIFVLVFVLVFLS